MSGICGIFYRDGRKVNEVDIRNMNNCISHRGPDGSDILCNDNVAFGHKMLHTTLESLNERLPYIDDKSGLMITSDARIDNRKELSDSLGLINSSDIPDSLFILKAYQKWGEKCIDKLLGDFAFVIWDDRQETMFCARDPMGVKQFYYHLSESGFYFATEIKSLFTLVDVPKKINELMVMYHLTPIFGDKKITYYKDIFHLPEAHNLVITKNNAKLSKYWEIDQKREVVLDSDKEYADEFRKIFFEAVKCRLRSNHQLGFFLSGGLDSSSIVCTAEMILSPKNNQPLKTFSAVFPGVPLSDETEYINAVLTNNKVDPHFIFADKISLLDGARTILWHVDAPIYGPNRFIHWNVYKTAKKEGVRVLLDGIDGDSTVSHGYGRLRELFYSFHWLSLLNELTFLSKISGLSKDKLLMQHVLVPIIPETFKKHLLRKIWSFLKGSGKNIEKYDYIINKDFLESFNFVSEYHQKYMTEPSKFKKERELHSYKLQSGILQFILEGLDHSAAALQIEPRYPYFDKRLIEFCVALPAEQKLDKGWERIILRRAMENVLPSKVQWRKRKSDLGYNFTKSLFGLEKNIEDIIFENKEIGDFVDMEMITKSLNEFRDYQGAKNPHDINLWRVTTLSLWLNEFKKII